MILYYVILFIIILILFFLFLNIYYFIDFPDIKVSLDDIKKDLKTGDLILFSRHKFKYLFYYLQYNIQLWFSGNNKWGHIGLIFKSSNDDIYVVEFTNWSRRKHKGLKIRSLEKYLEAYHDLHDAHFGIRKISQAIPNSIIKKLIYQNKPFKFQYNIIIILFYCLTHYFNYTKISDKRLFCSSFIAHLLKESNVLNTHKSANNFFPKDFINELDFDYFLNKAYSYQPIIEFHI